MSIFGVIISPPATNLLTTYKNYLVNLVIELTSSGAMTNLKFNKSSGSGNSILHVFGKLRSLISEIKMNIICYG